MRPWTFKISCRNDDVFNNDIIIKRANKVRVPTYIKEENYNIINLEDIKKCSLSKMEIPNSKIEIDFAYNIDFDDEKEDFEFDEDDFPETINGEKISFEEVKRNGFDYIKITAIDELDTKRVICELELA